MKAALLFIAAAAVLCSTASAVNGSSAPPCAATQLRGSVGQTQGAAGTIAFSVVLKNVSSARCMLGGYPTLQMTRAASNLRTRVKHGGFWFLAKPVRHFVLRSGGRASLLLAYNHIPHQGEPTCPTATVLRVRPPGAAAAVRVSVQMDPCNRGLVYESPLLPGVAPLP